MWGWGVCLCLGARVWGTCWGEAQAGGLGEEMHGGGGGGHAVGGVGSSHEHMQVVAVRASLRLVAGTCRPGG